MCLTVKLSKIDKWLLIFNKKHCLKPKVATKDIKVYKILKEINSNYLTPYMRERINFINGKADLPPVKIKAYWDWLTSRFFVDEGYHSFTTVKEAKFSLNFNFRSNVAIFNAIIPKGTKYFIGKYNDIVSEKLIIYQY